MPMPQGLRVWAVVGVMASAVCALAVWARLGWVQSPELAGACQAGLGPEWSCWGRQAVIAAFSHHRLGLLSCAAAAVAGICARWALAAGSRAGSRRAARVSTVAAVLAMCIASGGLVLYDADLSALGFLFGLVALLGVRAEVNGVDGAPAGD